jgi:3-deoxy-D-manno-octulosonic-acid transferase
MLYLYSVLIVLMLPFFFVRLALKSKEHSGYWNFWLERLGFFSKGSHHSIWVHAVSVGEVVVAIELINKLLQDFPKEKIIVTVMTPTGRDRVNITYKDNARVSCCYLPYDISLSINNFIKKFKPKALIIIETEIWPMLLHTVGLAKIPVVLVNARMSQKSCRGYARFFPLIKKALSNVSLIISQYNTDKKRFRFLSGDRSKEIITAGSIKYDFTPEVVNIERLHDKIVLMASCIHPGEEEYIFYAYKLLRKNNPGLQLIVAPRHIHNCEKFILSFTQVNPAINPALYSECDGKFSDVMFVDKMGVLASCYKQSDIVFIGGSFVSKGGQNPLEAASYSKPILMGPSRYNFSTITKKLEQDNALISVSDSLSLQKEVAKLIADKDYCINVGKVAFDHVMNNKGALELNIKHIKKILQGVL